ncbi:PREDICTED: uncharacterized protein LOC106784149 isoform X3 [Polistes canadensis]|uniref:uncharacterized protein LOC106784149 isoform X3 n=1 Tax=Polistes canadensis TaxID=91411 RepID=UPI000718CD71|nr:PREDICTED: uncharacterized protein LOC106784149 isoform X3 [Polistes canadensis]
MNLLNNKKEAMLGNKETVNLLDFLSETDTDIADLILTPRKKKFKRYRQGSTVKVKSNSTCGCKKSIRVILLWIIALLIIFWLIALSWLAAILYGEIERMHTSLKLVIAGNEGVPDTLQKCHSMSRDLQNNQTVIFTHLTDLRLQISNVTIQLANIQHGLHQVQEWVHAAPELANVPKDLKALSTTVVSLGSQISDLDSTVTKLKETNTRVQNFQTTVLQNITNIQHTISELSNLTQKPQILTTNETKLKTEELNAAILHVTNNLTHVNETLSRTLQWASEDQKKDHKILNSLLDTTQNVSTKVISLQGEYAKISEQITTLPSLTEQVKQIHAASIELNDKLKRLEQSYIAVKNSTTVMLNAITEMKNERKIVNEQDTKEMTNEGSQSVQRISTNT